MSTNFLQFNPPANNCELDSQYLVDASRVGGVPFNSEFYFMLANKMFYQWSTLIAAFAQSLANKGFVVSDANYAALIAVFANVLTTADERTGGEVVAYASSVNFDCSTHSIFDITLTGNCTATFTNVSLYQPLTIIVVQDGTGGHAFNMANGLGFVGGSSDPNSVSIQQFVVRADSSIRATSPVSVS
jgi:hypothetical protein